MGYWQERLAKAQTALTNKSIKATEAQLIKYYKNAMKRTIANFEATYDKLLSTIGEGRAPTPADLYKLDRYWQMQGQLKEELQKLGNKQAALLSKKFQEQYFNIYDSIALPAGSSFGTLSKENVTQLINSIWVADGKNWSSRIWENTEKLAETLNEELIHCASTGQKTTYLKQVLQERFNVSYSNADMLVRTEMAHIQTEAAKKRYEDYGVREVEILADEDERRCEICGKLHEKRYPLGAAIPIPAHPRCRCCIVPIVE